MLFELTGQIALTMGRGVPLVVYNAPYDLTVLEAENTRHGIDTLVSRLGAGRLSPIFDPMVLAKQADKFRIRSVKDEQGEPIRNEDGSTVKYCHRCSCGATDWTLSSTCMHYGVRLAGAHGAAADAVAAGRLFERIMVRHARSTIFRTQTASGLHHAQVGWKKEQSDGLRDFFNRVGVDDHDDCPDPRDHQCCCPEWPLHRACAPVAAAKAGA